MNHLRKLEFFRTSQAHSFDQAKSDGALRHVWVLTQADSFLQADNALTTVVRTVEIACEMMDGDEIVAMRLLDDGKTVLDTRSDPSLTPDELAFAESYKHNVAQYDGHTIEEFLRKSRDNNWSPTDEGYPTAMCDSWCLWHSAKRHYTKGA